MGGSRSVLLCVLVIALMVAAGTAFAATIYVPDEYRTIQRGIDAASDGDEVVVAAGMYLERINFKGKAITVKSTYETDPAAVAGTIIDGDRKGSVVTFTSRERADSALKGFTITRGSGTPDVYGGTSGGGVYCWRSSPTLISNTIRGNSAGGPGGGVYCENSSPTLTKNSIRGNSAAGPGGGLYCHDSSSPTLTSNTIAGNAATGINGYGGGVFCVASSSPTLTKNIIRHNTANTGGGVYCSANSSPRLTNNTISDNSASGSGDGAGGGVGCNGNSSPTLTNNTISRNTAYANGGGVYCFDNCSPIISNNTISGNSVWGYGGGVYCSSSSPTLTNNTITGNSADSGGGLGCVASSSPTLTNNTLSGNSAGRGGGGGVYCSDHSSPTLTNNTLSGNSAIYGGGVRCSYSSSPILKNSIVAFSADGGGLHVRVELANPSNPVVSYCDFYGNTDGNYVDWPDQTGRNGNLSVDPLFHSAATGDFHLRSQGGRWNPLGRNWVVDSVHSPCIDKGPPAAAFAREPMPNGGRVNMGAHGNTSHASKSV